MRNNEEYIIARQIAQYLRLQYPKVLFRFDMAGLNLSKAQAGMNKVIQQGRGYPDLMIFKSNDDWNGLFLELKIVNPYKKNGILKSNEHLKNQFDVHIKLRSVGYLAKFVVGFDEAKKEIDIYMGKGAI